jgi:hypothetical protein
MSLHLNGCWLLSFCIVPIVRYVTCNSLGLLGMFVYFETESWFVCIWSIGFGLGVEECEDRCFRACHTS